MKLNLPKSHTRATAALRCPVLLKLRIVFSHDHFSRTADENNCVCVCCAHETGMKNGTHMRARAYTRYREHAIESTRDVN